MPDYQQGRIYKIEASNSLPYIGSTTQQLCSRMSGHRRHHRFFEKTRKGGICRSYTLLSKIDCKITLIENYPCNSKEELLSRERHWINVLECLNKAKPNRTEEEKKDYHKQYYTDRKDLLKERSSNYYHTNKEKINAKRKEEYQSQK